MPHLRNFFPFPHRSSPPAEDGAHELKDLFRYKSWQTNELEGLLQIEKNRVLASKLHMSESGILLARSGMLAILEEIMSRRNVDAAKA